MFCILFLNIAFSLPQSLFKCIVLFPNFDHLYENSIQCLLSHLPLLRFYTRIPLLLLFSCSPTTAPKNVTDSQYLLVIHKGQMPDITEKSKKQNDPVHRIPLIPTDKFLCWYTTNIILIASKIVMRRLQNISNSWWSCHFDHIFWTHILVALPLSEWHKHCTIPSVQFCLNINHVSICILHIFLVAKHVPKDCNWLFCSVPKL